MKFSIVTPCFNAVGLIGETVTSVLQQTAVSNGMVELEYWICDGGSTDGTLELLKSFDDSRIKVISEPDSGMYDALAKGLRMASGDIVAYINAGDYYHKCAFEIVQECFQSSGISWLTGCSVLYNEKSQIFCSWLPARYRKRLIACGAYGRMLPPIQQESTFWSQSLNRQIDLLAMSKLKLAGDYFIWNRLAQLAELRIARAYLGGFKFHEGQLSSMLDRYHAEVVQICRPMNVFDYMFVVFDKLAWIFNDGIKCRLNKKIIIYDRKGKCWR